ncbi:hypothetical protein QYC28_05840 [Thermosynechococcus sp. HY596]|nr:hypothetical protein QYC28_05840 [Thermosynechococcus sp. HY596]
MTVSACNLQHAVDITSTATIDASKNVANLRGRKKVGDLPLLDIEITKQVKKVLAIGRTLSATNVELMVDGFYGGASGIGSGGNFSKGGCTKKRGQASQDHPAVGQHFC